MKFIWTIERKESERALHMAIEEGLPSLLENAAIIIELKDGRTSFYYGERLRHRCIYEGIVPEGISEAKKQKFLEAQYELMKP